MNKMRVQIIEQKQIWDAFVKEQPHTLFVQSSHYGEFYDKRGEKSWIVGVFDEHDVLIGGTLVLATHAKRGNFLYLPYGPLMSDTEKNTQFFKEILTLITNFLRSFAVQEGYDFVRVSPFVTNSDTFRSIFHTLGYRNAPMHVLAETTWILNIKKAEKEILQEMKKNHRNLIHRCEREGVKVEITRNVEALSDLHTLLDITAKRHNFFRFSRSYIKKEFESFSKHNEAVLFRAYLPDGTLDSTAIFMFYGNMSVYRHSASLGKDSKLPTSYLLQWEAIKEGKRRGMHWHNFWGIAPDDADKKHPFHGITHFKKGFGGEKIDILHCQDLPVSKKYWLNWIVETVRRLKRGF